MSEVPILVLPLVAIVAGLAGAGLAVARIRHIEARARRYLDERAAERIAYFNTAPTTGRRRSRAPGISRYGRGGAR